MRTFGKALKASANRSPTGRRGVPDAESSKAHHTAHTPAPIAASRVLHLSATGTAWRTLHCDYWQLAMRQRHWLQDGELVHELGLGLLDQAVVDARRRN